MRLLLLLLRGPRAKNQVGLMLRLSTGLEDRAWFGVVAAGADGLRVPEGTGLTLPLTRLLIFYRVNAKAVPSLCYSGRESSK